MPDDEKYHAYVVRGWSEDGSDDTEGATWRFRLQDLQTGEERGFTSVQALTSFLRQAFIQDSEQ